MGRLKYLAINTAILVLVSAALVALWIGVGQLDSANELFLVNGVGLVGLFIIGAIADFICNSRKGED